MSRRASLPGADELFRRTSPESKPQPVRDQGTTPQVTKSTRLQVAEETPNAAPAAVASAKAPKHNEKITFYCTRDDLMALERVRLALRADHGVSADRGRIVRAALAYVLEDFEARSDDSILVRKLGPQ